MMTNILLVLAIFGMVVGVYAVAMPTLTRRGWRLPFSSFFSDSEADDDAFTSAFEMPHPGDTLLAAEPPPPIDEVAEVEETTLPPVLRPADVADEEDDPTLTPLFESLDAPDGIDFGDTPAPAGEPEGAPSGQTLASTSAESPFKTAAPASGSKPGPRFNTVEGVSAQGGGAMTNDTSQPTGDAPAAPEAAAGGDDMLSLFAEDADAGKGPNVILEAVGETTLDDLMEEVRALRAILDKRAA
jgi:hypothetical protein